MKGAEKKGLCGLCSAGCWVVATYDEKGDLVEIRPDIESPMGMTCKIGDHSAEIIYSKDRLLRPMRRRGKKGSFDFDAISWPQAYDLIVDKLQDMKRKYGPEAVAIYTGVGSFEQSFCDIYQPKGVAVSSASSVLFPFGSPNTMGVGALCYVSFGMIAPHVTMGRMFINMYSDIENAELIVVWGTNPATDLPPVDLQRILTAQQSGAGVVVIDPRKTKTVYLTNGEWIPIRPGSDGALALGMCHVLIDEELYDDEFVSHWTQGFDEFASYVQHFRPKVVEHITGVPAATVVHLARRIAAAKGVSQLAYTGLEYANSGVQNIRATLVLWALAGQLDVPGGLCFTMPGNDFPLNRTGLVANPDNGPRLGREKFPIYVKYRDEAHAIALPESVLEGNPYKIRSLLILGSSLLTSWPNPSIWRQTLQELDFLVCINRQLTADAAYADIVLPATTYYENLSYMVYGSVFKIRERMISPVGEARPDTMILAELAKRLGYGQLYPQTEEDVISHVLQGSGHTLNSVRRAGGMVTIDTQMMEYKKWQKGLLRADGLPGFDTPTGKFEISSTILEEYGYDPLPRYTEPLEGPLAQPNLAKTYPLVFNSGARSRNSFHSQHHHVVGLAKDRPEPMVYINSKDAAAREIKMGDAVSVVTSRGSVNLRAYVTDDIVQGAIDANHAGGGPLGSKGWQDANINVLTDLDNHDPISGFPVYKSLLCNVVKVKGGGKQIMVRPDEIKESELNVSKGKSPIHTVYLDNNATTPIDPVVKSEMTEALDCYGNPSSVHQLGRLAKKAVEEARRRVAQLIGCTARRIVFTGGGSEANNLAIKGAALAGYPGRSHIITSRIEHPSVLYTCRWLEKFGFKVNYLDVGNDGRVKLDQLKDMLTDDTVLVSLMLANNETGVIQPIRECVQLANQKGALFHCDAVQGLGKLALNVEDLGVDLLTLSAHKVYGPKGVGALYLRKDVPVDPLVHGGGQEHGLRSGTENVTEIVGMGKACQVAEKHLEQMEAVSRLRDRLAVGIGDIVKKSRVNGHIDHRLANTLNITLAGFRGESLVMEMDRRGVCFSAGSACHSGHPAPSETLLAMGLSEEQAHCSLRFSLSPYTTQEDIEYVIDNLQEVITKSKNIVRFVSCK